MGHARLQDFLDVRVRQGVKGRLALPAAADELCVAQNSQLVRDGGLLHIEQLGDTTRIRILYALSESELCVCAIAELINMEQSAVSHQLKILKNAKLVSCRRVGKTNLYALADAHVRSIIGQGYEHLTEEEA